MNEKMIKRKMIRTTLIYRIRRLRPSRHLLHVAMFCLGQNLPRRSRVHVRIRAVHLRARELTVHHSLGVDAVGLLPRGRGPVVYLHV